ncbi:MAG TPA: rod shape-determining protein MreC [Trueperaceae bacterium]
MSSLLKAWYAFLVLCLLTLVLTALVGTLPVSLTSAIALPNQLFFRVGANLRQAALSLADRRDYQAELARLERQVAELQRENRQLQIEVQSYEQIRQVRQSQSPGVVTTAPVIGVDPSPMLSNLTLGKGGRQGIREDMPVTVPRGLVGIVVGVTPQTTVVRTITDPDSRVGVTVRDRGGQGVAVGELGGLVRVVNYNENNPVQVGDIVETSSRGGLFPRGIRVGEVIRVLPKDPNSLRREFLVRPSVEIPNLLEVALIEPL